MVDGTRVRVPVAGARREAPQPHRDLGETVARAVPEAQHQGLGRTLAHVLHNRRLLPERPRQPVQLTVLHQLPHLLVLGDQRRALRELLLGPAREVAADTEQPAHRRVETEPQWHRTRRELIGHVGHPRRHGTRRIHLPEPVLDHQPVHGIRVVGRPRLVRTGQDAEVDPASAATARLHPQPGVIGAQPVDDAVQIRHVPRPQPVAAVPLPRPARLAEGAVHVPLEEVDAVVPDQPGQPAVRPVRDLVPREVQDELVAHLGAGPAGDVQHPVGVLAVQGAVRIDHLRLDPDPEPHPEPVHGVGQRPEPLGKALRSRRPVAQPRPVASPRPEPAVVDDIQLHAEHRGPLGQRLLTRLVDVEAGGLPRVVEHRRQLPRPGQHMGRRVRVPGTARRPVPAVRAQPGEHRRGELLARRQRNGRPLVAHAAGEAGAARQGCAGP